MATAAEHYALRAGLFAYVEILATGYGTSACFAAA